MCIAKYGMVLAYTIIIIFPINQPPLTKGKLYVQLVGQDKDQCWLALPLVFLHVFNVNENLWFWILVYFFGVADVQFHGCKLVVQTFGLRAITFMVSTNFWFGFLNRFKVVSKFLVTIEFQEIQQCQLRRAQNANHLQQTMNLRYKAMHINI